MPVKPEILKISQPSQSRLFKVEAVDLRFSNGVERTYERLAVRGNGAVMIVALDAMDNIILIKEYAVGVEDYLLTLPKGLIDPGEDAIIAADRELKEGLYKNIRNISSLTKNINGWINFQGVLLIIAMVILLLFISFNL